MKKVYALLIVLLVGLSLALFYINLKRPVKIALVGNFEEERYNFVTSSVIAGRIAESDINNAEGIRGRNIELSIRDDNFNNPEATIKYLRDNKIEAIVTTATSEEVLKLKPYLDKYKIVCMSVGATSSALKGQDDYVYRMLPDDIKEVETLFQYLQGNNFNTDFAIIYSSSNKQYENSVKGNIIKLGGKVSYEDGVGDDSVYYTASNIDALKNKTILILASARDTAFVVQRLKERGVATNIYSLSWSGDKNLIYYGGKSVENLKLVSPVSLSKSDGKYEVLTKKLKAYGRDNGLIPCGVYEAIMVLQKGYEDKYEKHITLKESIDRINNFYGVLDGVIFDKYGDIKGNEYMFTVKDKQFIKVGGSSIEN